MDHLFNHQRPHAAHVAMTPKVVAAAARDAATAALLARLLAPGSTPEANNLLASSRSRRASASEMSGIRPMGELLLFAGVPVGLLPDPGTVGLHEEIEATAIGKFVFAFPAFGRPARCI